MTRSYLTLALAALIATPVVAAPAVDPALTAAIDGPQRSAANKARDAYRQQFDIGQRSLLDLLNSENELYTARRAYANAEYDRALAFARTHAGMSQLTAQLGIARPASLSEEAKDWTVGEDAPGRCPADAITMQAIDFQALARRVPAVPEQVRPTK